MEGGREERHDGLGRTHINAHDKQERHGMKNKEGNTNRNGR